MNKISVAKSSNNITKLVIKGIQNKSGYEIVKIKVKSIDNAICDFMIICHGNSSKHIETISESINETVFNDCGEKPFMVEGRENCEWVLMDYINVVVHIFKKEKREFYKLEELWGDAEVQRYE